MSRMYFPTPPTRRELLHALWFPALMAPFLFAYVRYRMLTWDLASANRRDGVDYSPEAWRLSGFVSVLFVFLAYPVMLAQYDEWLWEAHPHLTCALIAFWISMCGWVSVRHFQLQRRADEKLQRDLESLSRRSPLVPPAPAPLWLRLWGWGNGVASVLLLLGIARFLRTLR
jgi:hypothetical protein